MLAACGERATITGVTRGYEAGKKISGRKCFGIVNTLGLVVQWSWSQDRAALRGGNPSVILGAFGSKVRASRHRCGSDGGNRRSLVR